MFDTNFFRKFVEDPAFFKLTNDHLNIRYKDVPRAEMALFVSPVAFLEYLGITVPPPPVPVDLIKRVKPDFDAMTELAQTVYSDAFNFFSNEPSLSEARIKSEVAKRKNYVCTPGLKYWEIAVSRYSKPENIEVIYHSLAVEFFQKLPMKKDKASFYHPTLWINASARIAQGMDVCLFRTIQWRWSVDPQGQKIRQFGRDLMRRLSKSMGVRTHDDFLDAELVHYICFGKVEGSSLKPVHAFTCDPIPTVKDRIRLFSEGLKKIVDELNTVAASMDAQVVQKFPLHFALGSITFFDDIGNISCGPEEVSNILTQALS